jgi:hypothetical protein
MTDKEIKQVEQYTKPYAIVPVDMETTGLLVNALRAALAQPESGLELNKVLIGAIWDSSEIVALPQREWQGLTDEEIREGNRESWVTTQAWESAVWWAEAKLKEKNSG